MLKVEKLYYLLIAAICLTSYACKTKTTTPPQKNWQCDCPKLGGIADLTYPLAKQPLLSAHRGGKYIDNYPENCLETFQHIARKCPLIIECDVASTADGVLVLMHDNSIDRTTSGTGKLSRQNWSDLQSLTLTDHSGKPTKYHIPKLADVLAWAQGRAILSLDIKNGTDKAALITLLKKYEAHKYVEIITYDRSSAMYYQKHAPEYILSVNIRNSQELQWYQDGDFDMSKLKPFVGTRRKDKQFYNQLHDAGLLVTLGTLGNIDQQAQKKGRAVYDELIQQGVDVFATDYPLLLMDYYYCEGLEQR